uniref:Cytochrome P450 n=1 Tax=Timema bartmani TaxID=61472 RepID=A0A7R9EQ52_9NEOP|nr:unnamed protein product [Timema bartmani]
MDPHFSPSRKCGYTMLVYKILRGAVILAHNKSCIPDTIIKMETELPWNIILASTAVLAFIYWYFTSTFSYWEMRGVPFVKPLPAFGNIVDYILWRNTYQESCVKIYKKLEGHAFGGFYDAHKPVLLLRDPEIIKQVMVKDFANFRDRNQSIPEKLFPLGSHLFSLTGSRWRKLRVMLTPTFTSGKMKMMLPTIVECTRELISCLEKSADSNDILEMRNVIANFTTDVIGSCAFGLQINSMKESDSEFRRMGNKIFKPNHQTNSMSYREKNKVVRNDFLQLLIQLKNKGMVDEDRLSSKDDIHLIIRENVSAADAEKDEPLEMTDTLLAAQCFVFFLAGFETSSTTISCCLHELAVNPDIQERLFLSQLRNGLYLDRLRDKYRVNNAPLAEMTDTLLAAQCFVFFLAGFETSSTTISCCLHELAVNPDIQERLRKEVDKVLIKHGGKITYEALQDLKYMDAVVDETLRKYPPVGNLNRVCTKAYKIPDTHVNIDKDTKLIIPVYAIHHDPKYYPDPEKFDPSRFTENNIKSRPHFSYLPFGEGPRVCIGLRFGRMQVKVGLTALLTKYKFSVCEKTSIPLGFDPMSSTITFWPNKIFLKISHRDN